MTIATANIEECLRTFLSFYDLDVDIKGLVDEQVRSEETTEIEIVEGVLKRIGFQTRQENISPPALQESAQPVFIGSSDGACLLYMPEKTHNGALHGGTISAEERSAFDAASFTGTILHADLKASKTVLNTKHMIAGHALDWFWDPIIKYWPRYSEILISSVFMNVLVLAIPLYTMNIYDRVVINFAEETLIVLSVGVFIALLFDFIFKTIRSYLLERIAEDIGAKYDFDLMERLARLKPAEMNLSIGEQANVFRELQGIREFYAGRLVPTLVDFPFIFLFVIMIAIICPPLALVPLVISALIILCNFFAHIPVNRATEGYFASLQSKSSMLIETLAGLQTIKMFNATGSRLLKWDMNVRAAAGAARTNASLMSIMSNLSMFISQVGHVLVIFFGVYQIQQGNLTIGGLVACTILSGRAVGPVIGMSGIISRLKQSNDVLKVIDKFFQLAYDDEHDATKSAKGPFKGRIDIKNVSYQYTTQSKPALSDINLQINAGDSIGLIGKTAAGKSTLAKMLVGMAAPAEGMMTLDGFDYSAIPNTELRRTIAYVPQDAFFFNGTIRHNILLGREDISEQALQQAVRISGLDLVIQQTAQGLDTEVGELGHRLSGGQKQAISLARAIVRDPKIMVFDEPTTGMDNALEQRVATELKDYIADKTFIMVTHRTTLLPLVNRLVFLDAGRVIAAGPRDEILQKLNMK